MARSVRFDYFKVYAMSLNEERNVMEEGLCDLSDVLTRTQGVETSLRVFGVGNDLARLQDIAFNNDKWELHFLRIRKDNFPVRAHDDGTFDFFNDLGDEEGFGEEVSAIFDPANSVIIIRRNVHSLSPQVIASYFTNLINTIGFTVLFKPLIHPRSLELLQQDHLIRSAEIAVADVKNASPRTKRALGNIVTSAEEIDESVTVAFKIGIAQKGSKKYSRIPIYEEIESFARDENVKRAVVKFKADEDARVETVDLLTNRLVDYELFSDEDIDAESRNIRHTTVIGRMHQLYRTRLNDINNVYE